VTALRAIDLTGPLEERAWRYDDRFPRFSAVPATDFEKDGFLVHAITLATHGGTHTDASKHLFADGDDLDAIPLERYLGPATILRLEALTPLTPITGKVLQTAGEPERGDAVLIQTGWSKRWYDDDFTQAHPYLTTDAARWLLDRGARCVGMDTAGLMDPRLDLTPSTRTEGEVIDEILLRAGVPYVVGLVDLASVTTDRVWFFALPMKLAHMDGAPVRAIAVEGLPLDGKEGG
jgi:kynurenine formamidase